MNKSAYVRARVEPELKIQAETVFSELGLTPSQVINMLYTQVSKNHEIPLAMHIPNAETKQAIKEARAGKGLLKGKNIDDFFNELGN